MREKIKIKHGSEYKFQNAKLEHITYKETSNYQKFGCL